MPLDIPPGLAPDVPRPFGALQDLVLSTALSCDAAPALRTPFAGLAMVVDAAIAVTTAHERAEAVARGAKLPGGKPLADAMLGEALDRLRRRLTATEALTSIAVRGL